MKEFKGKLKGFPEEVVEWMLDQQEAQGNKRDVSVFEKDNCANKPEGGFTWSPIKWVDGYDFSASVIKHKNFDLFFEKYPKKDEPFKERVMFVSNDIFNKAWDKRVVFMNKNDKYWAWQNVETIDEAKSVDFIIWWKFAKEIEEQIVELTMEDISNGKGVGIKPEFIRIKK
jgi:mRNA-degrading endonuclease HigB of HigAB toxin-antitoxin module